MKLAKRGRHDGERRDDILSASFRFLPAGHASGLYRDRGPEVVSHISPLPLENTPGAVWAFFWHSVNRTRRRALATSAALASPKKKETERAHVNCK